MTANTYSPLWFQIYMPLQTEESTQKDAAFLARQLPLPRYQRVLDLCCGYGRHALQLAALGYRVTGLDWDEEAIKEAGRRATKAGQEISYIVGDMRRIEELSGEFDAVINMWQSFCYFDEETNRGILRQIYQKLTAGGRFIIDLYNGEYFEHHLGSTRQEINGITIEANTRLQSRRLHTELKYSDEQAERGGDHFDWQLYTATEFCALASEIGFHPLLTCTWADEARPASPDIARMQIVLEKPGA